MCKISDKSDKFLLNYSNLFRGSLFSGHSVYVRVFSLLCNIVLEMLNVLFFCVQIVRRYDILLIQEIRDISETAIDTLVDAVNTRTG